MKVRVSVLSEQEIESVLTEKGRRLFFGDERANPPVAAQ
jgi:hypothetical protein